MQLDGLTAPVVVEKAMNDEAPKADTEKPLAPTLRPWDIVVMDTIPTDEVRGAGAAEVYHCLLSMAGIET